MLTYKKWVEEHRESYLENLYLNWCNSDLIKYINLTQMQWRRLKLENPEIPKLVNNVKLNSLTTEDEKLYYLTYLGLIDKNGPRQDRIKQEMDYDAYCISHYINTISVRRIMNKLKKTARNSKETASKEIKNYREIYKEVSETGHVPTDEVVTILLQCSSGYPKKLRNNLSDEFEYVECNTGFISTKKVKVPPAKLVEEFNKLANELRTYGFQIRID